MFIKLISLFLYEEGKFETRVYETMPIILGYRPILRTLYVSHVLLNFQHFIQNSNGKLID